MESDNRISDPDLIRLARVYEFILSWPSSDEQKTADSDYLGQETGSAVGDTPAKYVREHHAEYNTPE